MKIPLSELEQVSKDPRAYLRKRERPSGSDFYGKSKYLTLQRAVFHYDVEKGDLDGARKYLRMPTPGNSRIKGLLRDGWTSSMIMPLPLGVKAIASSKFEIN